MSTSAHDSINKPKEIPPQQQDANPGAEHKMNPEPIYDAPYYKGTGKLKDRVAIVTGGDSGIGRSVCVLYAKEGADLVVVYLKNHEDANKTKALIEKEGRRCLLIAGDISDSHFCQQIVDKTMSKFGKIDILVNNAAFQETQENIEDITDEQLEKTFKTNIFSMFYLTRSAIKHMKEGANIINTTSVTAYKGKPTLLDYSSTKGAIVAFTRSLSQSVAKRGIRVNGVAPGPIWTPFIPASMPAEEVKNFGKHTTLGRPGQPVEVATSYVFLASEDGAYFTGQIMHPNGGTVVNA